VFKESVTKNKVLAIIAVFIGIAMYGNALAGLSLGILAALGSGLCDGVQNSIRRTLKGVDRNLVLLYSFASGAVVALVISFFSGEQMIKFVSILPMVVTLIYALLLLTLGNFLLYGFQHFDVNIATVILSMELVFALIFGLVLYREMPTGSELFGGLLIFLASVLSGIDVKALHAKLRANLTAHSA
jgi:drug/metabolite transporter (DMT)-like permease